MRFNYPGIKMEPALGTRWNWAFVIICSHRVVDTTAKKVVSRYWKNKNVFKMWKHWKCTCKARKNTVFHCSICKFVWFLLPSSSWLLELPSLAPRKEPNLFFAYQKWKPQFLAVVQFPFDNCHSPFSPTTFFELGVYNHVLFRKQKHDRINRNAMHCF
mgnify:CR=1 FL=1